MGLLQKIESLKITQCVKILCFIGVMLAVFSANQWAQEAGETLTVTDYDLDAILHFGSGDAAFLDQNQTERINLKKETSNELQVLRFALKNSVSGFEDITAFALNEIEAQEEDMYADVEPKVIGRALCYPNPFRQKEGGQIGYRLSKNMDIELHIYDMMANLIFKDIFFAGAMGGRAGYNKLTLDTATFNKFELSAGIYFFLLIYQGKIMAKGKMAVIP